MSVVGTRGYKETEIGWIPNDWQATTLASVAEVNPSRTKPKSDEDKVSFLAMGDVSENGHVISTQTRNYHEVAKGFTSFIDGDVLVAKITPCFENGKGALISDLLGGLGFGSTEFHVIRAFPGLAVPALLYFHTRADVFRRLGEKNMVGSAGQKRVPTEFLRQYPLALPPMAEQKKIAAVLMAVDDKLDIITRQIEVTQKLRQGLMQTLFSRGVGTPCSNGRWVPHTDFMESEVGEIPAGWKVKTINDVFDVVERPIKMRDDQTYRRVTVKRRHGGIELRDETKGENIKVKNQFLLEAGDFLISERQIVHGACGIVPPHLEGALVSNEYLVLKACAGFDAVYFSYLVQLLKYAKLFFLCSQGVDIEKFLFKPKDWLKKRIPVPPLLEQQRIAQLLSSTEVKTGALQKKYSEYQNIKRGLMQKLLTGEWRVTLDTPQEVALAA